MSMLISMSACNYWKHCVTLLRNEHKEYTWCAYKSTKDLIYLIQQHHHVQWLAVWHISMSMHLRKDAKAALQICSSHKACAKQVPLKLPSRSWSMMHLSNLRYCARAQGCSDSYKAADMWYAITFMNQRITYKLLEPWLKCHTWDGKKSPFWSFPIVFLDSRSRLQAIASTSMLHPEAFACQICTLYRSVFSTVMQPCHANYGRAIITLASKSIA